MALKVTLKPGEKFVINGAVVVNGDRRTNLVIQNKVSILREKDIMQPAEASTPSRRIYFAIMMLYMDEQGKKKYQDEFLKRMAEFMDAVSSPEIITLCVEIIHLAQQGAYYKALTVCKKLFPLEAERLGTRHGG